MKAALGLAARGWSVFPLQPRRKVPSVHDWEAQATTDPAAIQRVWGRRGWNIGVACGPSNLVVVDLDGADDHGVDGSLRHGRQALVLLAAAADQIVPSDTFSVLTPKGQHLYFEAPLGVEVRNTAGRLAQKVDTRARGGYVVGAGSVVDGQVYRVICDLPPQPLPAWLIRLLVPSRTDGRERTFSGIRRSEIGDSYVAAAVRNESTNVANAPVGRRNHTLFVAAARLARFVTAGALSEADVRSALMLAADRHLGVQSFDDAEVIRTIESGLRRGQAT
jgi:hypothetical protein